MSEFVIVQTPDGPVRFPKGMSRADMAAALNKLPKAAAPSASSPPASTGITRTATSGFGGGSSAGGGGGVGPNTPVTPLAPAPLGVMGTIEDVAKSGLSGIARGGAAIADAPRAIADLYGAGIEGLMTKTGLASPEFAAQVREGMSSSVPMLPTGMAGDAMSVMTGGGSEYKGKTTAGEYAGTIGEFLPGAALTGGLNPANLLKFGVLPATASEAAGQATEGTKFEPWARLVASMVAPMAVGAVETGIRAASGLPRAAADPERLKLAKVLDDFGVPITAGQRTGADGLRKIEAATTLGAEMAGQQADDFTAAALKAVGADGNRATPEVMKATADRIGAVFDDVMQGIDITPDPATVTASAKAIATYKDLAPKATAVPLIGAVHQRLVSALRGGQPIPAETLATWRSGLSKLTASADAATRTAAVEMLDAVDNAMAASLTAAGRTGDIARLTEARGQWRNMLAIEGAAAKAGEDAALGIISPARLAAELTRQGKTAWARGTRGDLADLSRAGVGVMSPLPTVSAGGVRSIEGLSRLGSMSMGGALGASMGSPGLTAILGGLGYVAPGAMNYLRAGPLQGLISNMATGQGAKVLDPRLLGTIPGALAQ